jgi:hypothetical protein
VKPRAALATLTLGAIASAIALSSASCGVQDFDPISKLDSVRILASRADKPYAKPGETVNLEVLAVDARAKRPKPMEIYWIPFVCQNPLNDAYFACFTQALRDGGADGAASGDGGANPIARLQPGVDLTPFLPKGPTYSFTMPQDIIETHPVVEGAKAPYGLAIVFNIACAGRVKLDSIDPSRGPQQIPIGCFDDDDNRLGPNDYVLGFTRVYAYDERRNQNPSIAGLSLDGVKIDPAQGFVMDTCKTQLRRDCPKLKIETLVNEDQQEVDPEDIDPDGVARREQIYVSYYATTGQLSDSARLLYDPKRGKISNNYVEYQPANEVGDGAFFAVVKDNRGGASWIQVALHAK